MNILEAAVEECGALRASLIRRCRTADDAMAVATAFVLETRRIYRELGGERLVAAQFYHLADEAAVAPAPPPRKDEAR